MNDPWPRGRHTASYELDSERISQFTAHSIMKEFDEMVGGPLMTSALVYLASLRVCRIIFGPSDDPILALDESSALERIPTVPTRPEDGDAMG